MRIKLLQWNIFYKEKIQRITETIKKINPDIVNLQELVVDCQFNPTVHETAKYVGESLGYNYFWGISQTWPEGVRNKRAQGNGIFSRFSIIKRQSKHIQKPTINPKGPFDEGRIYVEAQLKIGDKTLNVGTTHLSYVHKFSISERKKKEVNNLVKILKQKKSNFVFSGDLNSTPGSYTVEQISKYLKNCGPLFDQPTWTTKPMTDYKGWTQDELKWRLDYVFATKDIKVISSKIIKTKYSDHLPILVTLEI